MRWLLILPLCVFSCDRGGREPLPPPPLQPSSSVLPDWFADSDAPMRHISGRLLAGEEPQSGTVHIRLDAPDPTVWAGHDVQTSADGRFDFGDLPSGHYVIVATADARTSRAVSVDTTGGVASDISIYLHPCTEIFRKVVSNGRPVAGAQIDIAGVVIAKTEGDGRYSACVTKEPTVLTIRAPGFAFDRTWTHPGMPTEDELSEDVAFEGVVVGADGKPLVGVAVQPVNVEQVRFSHGSPYGPIPVQATTDSSGGFVLRGLSRMDQAAEKPARYNVRISSDGGTFIDKSVELDAARPGTKETVRVASLREPPDDEDNVRGRMKISGRVMYGGKPLPDALVQFPIINVRTYTARTGPDGGFELLVPPHGAFLSIEHPTGISTERTLAGPPGSDITDMEILIGRVGRISGVVVDENDRPIEASVRAEARDAPIARYSHTDAAGFFSIDDIESDRTYDIVVEKGDGPRAELEVRLDSDKPVVEGLRIVVGAVVIVGTAVDAAGEPVKGATVTVNEATFHDVGGGAMSPDLPWVPSGVAGGGMSAQFATSQWVHEPKTDAAGQFRWSPVLEQDHVILLVTSDGRSGIAERVPADARSVRITMERSGTIEVVCKNFRPMSEAFGGGVDVTRGALKVTAACAETVGDLPPGRYSLVAKEGMHKFASTEVVVQPDTTAEAVLEVQPAGTVRGTVVSYPSKTPVVGADCDARWPNGDDTIGGDPGATSGKDGSFKLKVSRGRLEIWCEASGHARGVAKVDLSSDTAVTVYVVPEAIDDIDLGVDFTAEAGGARVAKATRAAAKAGLKAGDLVRAIDGSPLADLGRRAMAALAFTLPSKSKGTWTVERAGKTLELEVVAE